MDGKCSKFKGDPNFLPRAEEGIVKMSTKKEKKKTDLQHHLQQFCHLHFLC